jgi:PKD repeat protein
VSSPTGITAQQVSTFIPVAQVIADTEKAQVGANISFSGSTSKDYDGRISSFAWNFGDGLAGTGERVDHVYSAPGTYEVTLTVTDDMGATATSSVSVQITAIPALPTVKIGTMDSIGVEFSIAPFIGLASTDASNRALVHVAAIGLDPNAGDSATWTWRWDFGDGSPPLVTRSCRRGQDCGCTKTSCALDVAQVSDVFHEYRNPGRYLMTVVFNNGVGDSPPATAEVEVLPALNRQGGNFAIAASCSATDTQLRFSGRTDRSDVLELWSGGFALGRHPLEEWLMNDRGRSLLLRSDIDAGRLWVVKRVDVRLPDLSFQYDVTLPVDVSPGDFVTLDWSVDWSRFGTPPVRVGTPPPTEGTLLGALLLPCLAPSNLPPIAHAGGPYNASVGSPVTFDGRASSDPDGEGSGLTFRWFIGERAEVENSVEQPTLSGPAPVTVFTEPGTYPITLIVTDPEGAFGFPDTIHPQGWTTVTVASKAVDTTPPSITNISATPSRIWPPNHKMVEIKVHYAVTDNATKPSCRLEVSSNEVIDGQGDGRTSSDWTVIDAHTVRVRAERSGTQTGRIYTIHIVCSDEAGNLARQQTSVQVQHDLRRR